MSTATCFSFLDVVTWLFASLMTYLDSHDVCGPLSQLHAALLMWVPDNSLTGDAIHSTCKLNIVLFTADDASLLGQTWVSPTLVGLHCARVCCVCLLACLLVCLFACLLGTTPLVQLQGPLNWWIVWRQFINVYHLTRNFIKNLIPPTELVRRIYNHPSSAFQ